LFLAFDFRPSTLYYGDMRLSERITFDPRIMGGRPRIRETRITVGAILHQLRFQSPAEILRDYPELEPEDIDAALEYAAFLAEGHEVAV
jgi:uncharacterized protein (DUF433 family)